MTTETQLLTDSSPTAGSAILTRANLQQGMHAAVDQGKDLTLTSQAAQVPVLLLTSFMCHCSMLVPSMHICDFAVEHASLASPNGKQSYFNKLALCKGSSPSKHALLAC